MKIRLSKGLLALLASLAVSTAEAGYYQIGGIIGVDKDGNAETKTITVDDIPVTSDRYAPTAKDGSGTLTIETGGTIANALFVREGALVLKDKAVSLTGTREGLANNDGFVPLSVGGKNSKLEVDNAELSIGTWGAALVVGGIDGSGSLVLKNKARLENKNGFSTFIGQLSYRFNGKPSTTFGFQNMHASTATTSGNVSTKQDRYQGTYRLSDPNDTWSNEFGTGYVEVTGKSYFDTGAMGALYMADGKLIVDDHSTVKAGTDSQYANSHTSEIGEIQGCKSEIEVKGNSELHFRSAVNFGWAPKTNSSMLIDKSTLQVDGHLSVANSILSSATGIKASIVLQDHATAKFNTVKIGHENILDEKSAFLKVDSTSAVEALRDDSLIELIGYGAYVENEGSIGVDMLLNGGQLTAMDGSSMADVTVNGATFMVYGNVEMTGALTLNTYAYMEFNNYGIINLNGNNLTIADDVSVRVYLSEGQSADNLAIFANVGEVFEGDYSIDVYDTQGEWIKKVAVSDVITVLVPEPATSTLSLLALAGLAARRRRK